MSTVHSFPAQGGVRVPVMATAAWRRLSSWLGHARLQQAGALLVLAALVLAGSRLHNAPSTLSPTWIAIGAASALTYRWRGRGMLLAILAVLSAASLATAAWLPTLQEPLSPWLALLDGALATLQAGAAAAGLRRLGARPVDDHRWPLLGRVMKLLRFVFLVSLPLSLLAGMLAAAVHAGDALLGPGEGPPLWEIGLCHAAATGLSIALLTPLAWAWRGAGSWPALAVWLASAGIILPSLHNGAGLYVMPVLALLAGASGGLWLAALCCATMAAGLTLGVQWSAMAPFEGPDGFIVQLLFVWRLLVIGFVASLWSERRASGAGPAHRGGRVHRHPGAMAVAWQHDAEQHTSADAALLWVRSDSRRWHPAGLKASADAHIAGRNSQAWSSDTLRLSDTLRSGDRLAPFADQGLVIALSDLPRRAAPGVQARIEAHLKSLHHGIEVSIFPMTRAAAALCLTSAGYLDAIEQIDGEPAPAAAAVDGVGEASAVNAGLAVSAVNAVGAGKAEVGRAAA